MSELFSLIGPFGNLVRPRDNGLNGSWTIFRPTLKLCIILQRQLRQLCPPRREYGFHQLCSNAYILLHVPWDAIFSFKFR